MANTTNYEVDIVYGGQMDEVWGHALEIAEVAREAEVLAARYGRWAQAVANDPKRELKRLAKALHTAHEASALTKPQRTKTLIEVLTEVDALTNEVLV